MGGYKRGDIVQRVGHNTSYYEVITVYKDTPDILIGNLLKKDECPFEILPEDVSCHWSKGRE